jgi:hypothetical protein
LSIDTHFTQLVCKTSEKSRDERRKKKTTATATATARTRTRARARLGFDGQQFLGWAHGTK